MGEAPRAQPTFEELYQQIVALPQGITGEILGPGWLRTPRPPRRRSGRVRADRLPYFWSDTATWIVSLPCRGNFAFFSSVSMHARVGSCG